MPSMARRAFLISFVLSTCTDIASQCTALFRKRSMKIWGRLRVKGR